jgi:hypothetical protein
MVFERKQKNYVMKTRLFIILGLIISLSLTAQNTQTATTTAAVRLFSDKDDLTSVLTIIPKESKVEIVKNDVDYLLVNYDSYQGYILSSNVSFDQGIVTTAPSQVTSVSDSPQSQTPVNRYDKLLMKYDPHMATLLYQHKVWKGSTTGMVLDSWGKPEKINRTYSDNDVEEEWIYLKKWLYFKNDILIKWGPVK